MSDKPILIRMSDVQPVDCESAYRRGFTQGMSEALRILQDGRATKKELSDYIDFLMTEWRSRWAKATPASFSEWKKSRKGGGR